MGLRRSELEKCSVCKRAMIDEDDVALTLSGKKAHNRCVDLTDSSDYYDIAILPREEQIDEEGELKGVNRLNHRDALLEISIPEKYRRLAKTIEEEKDIDCEEVYRRWMVNAIVHEDIHYILEKLGVDGHNDRVSNIAEMIDIYKGER